MENNPFINKNLRSLYDPASEKWWFSAVDICAILIDSDYDTARKYWKSLKNSLAEQKNQLVENNNQLKLPSYNGKYYFTDVLDAKEVIYLIQIIPSPKAEPFRLWVANVMANNTPVEQLLIDTGEVQAGKILKEYEKRPDKLHERLSITKRRLV